MLLDGVRGGWVHVNHPVIKFFHPRTEFDRFKGSTFKDRSVKKIGPFKSLKTFNRIAPFKTLSHRDSFKGSIVQKFKVRFSGRLSQCQSNTRQ